MFPLSSVVFAIEPLAEAVTEGPPSEKCQLDSQLLQRWPNTQTVNNTSILLHRISKLATMCQKQYVLLVAAVLGTQELAILSALQKHFLNDGIQFIPVHNINECVQSMINIAKVLLQSLRCDIFSIILNYLKVACHPLKDIVTERFHRAIQGVLSENAVLSALHQMHLSPHGKLSTLINILVSL